MGLINRLDPLVSSQIAAGEVVERPASALKELVENSLDAGASRILIDFEDSGLSLIRVSDNGSGMRPDDAPLSVERFATSKLSTAEDLSRIASLGFRGEALPSIASCSHLTIETKAEGFDSGRVVTVSGGTVPEVTERGLPQGTTVTVRDLFFNTPARLRFVKSRVSERQAIIDVVIRLALAWPDVAFVLRTGGKTILSTPGQGLESAIASIFGPDDASKMVEVSWSGAGITVSGFAGRPSLYRRQRDRQFFSVNCRPVKDAGLGWALDSAYAGMLPSKTYPMAVLEITLPAGDVDVNVHPTKAQVKFRDEAAVKRAVSRAVSEALRESTAVKASSQPVSRPVVLRPSSSWSVVREQQYAPRPGPVELSLWSPRAGQADEEPGGWQYLGSIEDTYLLASTGSSLLIVDKHALMESLTYRALLKGKSGSQDLLMAEIVRLDPKEAATFEESEEALASLGFGCRLVGDKTVMVTAVPLVLGRALNAGALSEVLSKINAEVGQSPASPERLLECARLETAACHASVRAREPLSKEEAVELLEQMRRDPEARTCPHGRPVVREITMREMGEFFGRTSHESQSRL